MGRRWHHCRRVYLIECAGFHKIGSSLTPEARVDQVCTGGALIHSFASTDAYRLERALHHRFATCRDSSGYGREWFSLTQADVNLIRTIERADTVADLPPELQPPIVEDPDCSVRLNPNLLAMAEVVAEAANVHVFRYLDELLRERIGRDYQDLTHEFCYLSDEDA